MAHKKGQKKATILRKGEETAINYPIIPFVNDVKPVANFWLRSGDTSSANNFVGFLEKTLLNFGDKKVGPVRLDSGFFQKDIIDYLELKRLRYIIAAKFTHPIQHLIDRQDFWVKIDEGIEICDKFYQAKNREKPRRTVIVRQKIKERPNAAGRMLSLFRKMKSIGIIVIQPILPIRNNQLQMFGEPTEPGAMQRIESRN